MALHVSAVSVRVCACVCVCVCHTQVAVPLSWLFPLGLWVFRGLTWPWSRRVKGWRPALPLYIPTTKLRQLVFKIMADLRQLPSGAELLRLAIQVGLGAHTHTHTHTSLLAYAHPRVRASVCTLTCRVCPTC